MSDWIDKSPNRLHAILAAHTVIVAVLLVGAFATRLPAPENTNDGT